MCSSCWKTFWHKVAGLCHFDLQYNLISATEKPLNYATITLMCLTSRSTYESRTLKSSLWTIGVLIGCLTRTIRLGYIFLKSPVLNALRTFLYHINWFLEKSWVSVTANLFFSFHSSNNSSIAACSRFLPSVRMRAQAFSSFITPNLIPLFFWAGKTGAAFSSPPSLSS